MGVTITVVRPRAHVPDSNGTTNSTVEEGEGEPNVFDEEVDKDLDVPEGLDKDVSVIFLRSNSFRLS
jgi:hypothetical protein